MSRKKGPIVDNPFASEFAFRESDCEFPLKMLYQDYLYTSPKINLLLTGWYLPECAFTAIAEHCKHAKSINLDYSHFDPYQLEKLRGLSKLQSFSMQAVCTIDVSIIKIFASWPSLTELNISECRVNLEAFKTMALTLKRLKILKLSKCPGLNDFCLSEIAQMMQRFRFLRCLDFSYCTDFSDEGMLVVLNAGPNMLTSINYSGCTCITSLSIAGLRKRMSVLDSLDLSHVTLTQSANTFISYFSATIQF